MRLHFFKPSHFWLELLRPLPGTRGDFLTASKANYVQEDGECSAETLCQTYLVKASICLHCFMMLQGQPGLESFDEASLPRIPGKPGRKQDLLLVSLVPLGLSLPQDTTIASAGHSCPESGGEIRTVRGK